jgi:hypothetical protein
MPNGYKSKKHHAGLMGLLLLGASVSAHAFVVDSTAGIGDESKISWALLGTDNSANTDLTGEALFKLTDFNAATDTISFEVTLSNTTDPGNSVNAGLQKFGFGSSANASVASWSQLGVGPGKVTDVRNFGNPDNDLDNAVAPGNTQVIEIVAATGTGAGESLQGGEEDLFELVLSVPDLGEDGVEFSPFAVKYQTDVGSYEFPGGEDPSGAPPAGEAPVPGTLALLGIGALLLGRRKLLKLS